MLDSLHDNIKDWSDITKTSAFEDVKSSPSEELSSLQFARKYNVSVSSVMLEALAIYMREAQGQLFLKEKICDIRERVKISAERLNGIDWSKDSENWKGRCIRMGKLVKNKESVILTSNFLLKHAGFSISFDNEIIEHKYNSIKY